jgi:Cof subfamily protein (haloacid dehalogenase superfamily)
MEMPYKMIVLDLDDTLLQDDLTISDRTREGLMRAQRQGVRVVLASGRPTGAIWRYARELEIAEHGGFIISFNGAVLTDAASGAMLFQKALSKETIHELYELSVAHGTLILSYVDDQIVTPLANEWAEVEQRLTGMEVRVVPDFKAAVQVDCIKAILLQEPTFLRAVSETLHPLVRDRLNMVISKPFFLEFTDKGIDKRHSLGLLAQTLQISSDEVIAIGDSYNDLGMIEFAGLGICMANGPAEVRAKADHVTASNMEDGIALALERFVFDSSTFDVGSKGEEI